MKKFLCVLLCLLLTLSIIPVSAEISEVMAVANCNEYVSLRKTPDTKAEVLEKVHLGEFVTDCAASVNDFTYCSFNGKSGYILSKYLKTTPYTLSDNLLLNQMVYNCEEYVSLRKSPDTSSDRLVKVPKDAVVTSCIGYMGNWVLCSYNGKTGYILSKYLKDADYNYLAKLTPTPTAQPSVTPTPAISYPEVPYYMTIANVSEWATMRDRASTSGKQIARVPLGSVVEDCVQVSEDFICCSYNGTRGYIRMDLLVETMAGFEYLGDLPDYGTLLSTGYTLLAESFANGYSVLVQHTYADENEEMFSVVYNKDMQPVWSDRQTSNQLTELDSLNAFVAGTQEAPVLVIFRSGSGLIAYNIGAVKQVAWICIQPAVLDLTSGNAVQVTEDGTIYIIGYYNSAPVCINSNGTIRWQATTDNTDLYWAFKINATINSIEVYYDSAIYTENMVYKAIYSLDGVYLGVTMVDADSVIEHYNFDGALG